MYRIIDDTHLDRVIGMAQQAIDTYPACYTQGDHIAMVGATNARTINQPERDAAVKVALAMEKDESSFASCLGALFLASDGDNRARLLAAFADVFEMFGPTFP